MKRHSGLVRLSRQHHAALVLAKRAAHANEEDAAGIAAEIARAFETSLEPHFGAEEKCLLPLLAEAGKIAASVRTRKEHEELRKLAGEIAVGNSASLTRFGELLESHVRFEERELFPLAESVLSEEVLASLEACQQHLEQSS